LLRNSLVEDEQENKKINKIYKICSQYKTDFKGVHDCFAIRESKASRRK